VAEKVVEVDVDQLVREVSILGVLQRQRLCFFCKPRRCAGLICARSWWLVRWLAVVVVQSSLLERGVIWFDRRGWKVFV
jgi:hypothetical protein